MCDYRAFIQNNRMDGLYKIFVAFGIILLNFSCEPKREILEKMSPDNNITTEQYGIVRISTGHLRAEPGNSAELIDQAIMGNILRLPKGG